VVGDRYVLERPLAKGGMGSVWVARHRTLDVSVAVKLMTPTESRHLGVARFEREAKAAASLRTPHVAHIHDYGVEDGTPFIAMELLEGEDLARRLSDRGPMSLAETARTVEPIAKALSAAHAAGLVHRDIKPRNVFLARSDTGDEIVKVLDFGIVKDTRPDAGGDTSSSIMLGTPYYMSPEQARGADVDPRSDVWSLGVVAFEMLTGVRVFEGATLGDTIARICNDARPAATALAAHLPAEIDAFFERALARSPTKRFATARELAEALSGIARAAGAAADVRIERPSAGSLGALPTLTSEEDDSGGTSLPRGRDRTTLHEVSEHGPGAPSTAPPVDTGSARTLGALSGDSRRQPSRRGRQRVLLALLGALVASGVWLAWPRARAPETLGVAEEPRPPAPARTAASAAPAPTPPPTGAPSAAASAPSASASGPASARSAIPEGVSPRPARSAGSPRSGEIAAPRPTVDDVFGIPVAK
jgi:serine/threonine-protein kinase